MSLTARIFGADEPEDQPVTAPRQPYPPVSGFPWYWGVPGLDPSAPAGDWAFAAQCTAMACASYVFAAAAGRAERWVLPRKASPAERFLGWLLEAREPAGAARRRLALRLTCEQAAMADVDQILRDAQALHDACSPG